MSLKNKILSLPLWVFYNGVYGFWALIVLISLWYNGYFPPEGCELAVVIFATSQILLVWWLHWIHFRIVEQLREVQE